MGNTTRALVCRTVHTDPDRRWVAHIADTLDQDPGQNTGRIAQRRDDGTGHREYAPTWEAALAAARAHLAPAETACGYCHHPGAEPCEEPGTGPELCTRAAGHEPPHVACGEHHGQVMWATTVETTLDPAPAAESFAASLGRALRPLDPGHRPALAAFNAEQRARAERERLGRLVQDVADGDGSTVEVYGVKIAPCDTYGKTAEERHLEQALDAALARARDLEQQQAVSLEVAEELAAQLEKVEQERGEARADRDAAERERDEWRAEAEPRPLTPTDEMVARGMAHIEEKPWTVRSLLTAALTEPPARPEGAEEIEALLSELPDTMVPATDAGRADLLASRGVRVAPEDGAR